MRTRAVEPPAPGATLVIDATFPEDGDGEPMDDVLPADRRGAIDELIDIEVRNDERIGLSQVVRDAPDAMCFLADDEIGGAVLFECFGWWGVGIGDGNDVESMSEVGEAQYVLVDRQSPAADGRKRGERTEHDDVHGRGGS